MKIHLKQKTLKALILSVLVLGTVFLAAKVLNFPVVTQEQNQWCWAGVSRAVLLYYGKNITQCTIANFTRNRATWHNFGTVDCCVDPSQGCNYWNYMFDTDGSIEDILNNWGIQSDPYNSNLTRSKVTNIINDNRPFIMRWGWTGGGGHFLVGHGFENDNIHYMDPWYGEGLKIGTYAWVCASSDHTWTHSLVMTTPYVVPKHNLKIVSGAGGTTTPAPGTYSYDKGTDVSVQATAQQYNVFGYWGGDVTGSDNPVTVHMDSDKFIMANFRFINAPKNFGGQKRENRSLSQCEYINVLMWESHPSNEEIEQYRIYLLQNTTLTLLAEVESTTHEYLHRKVSKYLPYTYVLVAVSKETEGYPTQTTVD
ncbi:MAG: C39 family peptidase [Candidatus Aminicenantes bacterium]|nr:C39 family peptidase [Candidatus Aminicenantes bacterium]